MGRQAAEDLVAQTFLVAFMARDRYDPPAPSARPWLYGILTNLLRGQRRAEVRAWRAQARAGADPSALTEDKRASRTRPSSRLDAQAAVRSLAGVLASLPPGQRDLLLLHVWAGLDYPRAGHRPRPPAGHRPVAAAPRQGPAPPCAARPLRPRYPS